MAPRKNPSREVARELERAPLLPARSTRAEVMPRVVIEIRPETPISVVWRLYMKEGPSVVQGLPAADRMLRKGSHVYGGTKLEAHYDAIRVAEENGFMYEPPADMKDDPVALAHRATLILPPGASRDA